MAGALSFAGPLTFFTGALSVMQGPAAIDLARMGLWWMLYGISLWCLMLAAGYGCERLVRRRGRLAGGGIWLLAACSAAALVNLLTAGREAVLMEQGLVHSALTMHLHGFIFSLIMALLYFAYLRRSRRHELAAARLAAAQAAQRHARRRIVQARLKEVQARIDPQLLFEMLGTVRRLYERDSERAERFLDELIAFLRAALPRLRTAWSSLVRETELASALVSLRALAGSTGRCLNVNVTPDAMHARFPPGVLLPLVDAAAANGMGSCSLVAARAGDRCRVVLSVDEAPPEDCVARVRSLLEEIHGTSGTVQIEPKADSIEVIVTVPYELS